MYTASWEIVDEDREDFGECDTQNFFTLEKAIDWLGFRLDRWDYNCVVFNSEGQIVLTGWMA